MRHDINPSSLSCCSLMTGACAAQCTASPDLRVRVQIHLWICFLMLLFKVWRSEEACPKPLQTTPTHLMQAVDGGWSKIVCKRPFFANNKITFANLSRNCHLSFAGSHVKNPQEMTLAKSGKTVAGRPLLQTLAAFVMDNLYMDRYGSTDDAEAADYRRSTCLQKLRKKRVERASQNRIHLKQPANLQENEEELILTWWFYHFQYKCLKK